MISSNLAYMPLLSVVFWLQLIQTAVVSVALIIDGLIYYQASAHTIKYLDSKQKSHIVCTYLDLSLYHIFPVCASDAFSFFVAVSN